MGKRRIEWGQGLLEMALILPVLLILLLGVVEVGYAMRAYLVVVNADREGCRFAARGRFSDAHIAERVISAAPIVYLGTPPSEVPYLRTHGDEPNTGIIITHIPMDSSGAISGCTTSISGVISMEGGGVRPIMPSDSVLSMTQLVQRHGPSTQSINAMRQAAMYEPMDNNIVVVEVFFMHHPLWNVPLLPVPDPWKMHAQTEMRVTGDRGGGTRGFFGAR